MQASDFVSARRRFLVATAYSYTRSSLTNTSPPVTQHSLFRTMPPLQRLTATRSRMFRRAEELKTPEPLAQGDLEQPPPAPLGARFRLRRRIASQLNTPPTQDFLESVAAADIPMPSIEGPLIIDQDMVDTNIDDMPLSSDGPGYPSSPKTPAPGISQSSTQKHWSINSGLESSADYDTSRPSTAHSTLTSSASLFSFLSDEGSTFEDFLFDEDRDKTIKVLSSSKSRKAPWTRAMRHHLWSTYQLYLEDPQVTPIRFGKSNMPPQGVLSRVARMAKRSWKGSKSQPRSQNMSRCTTPTAQDHVFVQWPHTHAATRTYLRDLCRARAGSTARNGRYMESSLTPFGKTAGCRNRRSPGIFSGSDMAMSLAVSTSDSMQPQGPLAQLTRSAPQQPLIYDLPPLPIDPPVTSVVPRTPAARTRLGSPFVAKSYGPSASLSFVENLVGGPERRSHTVGARRNSASARMNRSRSNTQRRRPRQAELEQRRAQRPSLSSDMWCEPPKASPVKAPSSDEAPTSPVAPSIRSEMFAPRNSTQELFAAAQSAAVDQSDSQQRFEPMQPSTPTTHTTINAPARLGSPFAAIHSSFSFPNRLLGLGGRSRGLDFGAIRRPFASVNQSTNDGSPRSSLTRRLAYLDERLKDFRQRSPSLRRSQSPF